MFSKTLSKLKNITNKTSNFRLSHTNSLYSHLSKFKFATQGKVNGKITPNTNGTFRRTGTIKYFNNVTGENEIHPAVFEGITSDNQNIIAVRITYTDTRHNGGAVGRDYSGDYVLRKNFEPEPMVCAFSD